MLVFLHPSDVARNATDEKREGEAAAITLISHTTRETLHAQRCERPHSCQSGAAFLAKR